MSFQAHEHSPELVRIKTEYVKTKSKENKKNKKKGTIYSDIDNGMVCFNLTANRKRKKKL